MDLSAYIDIFLDIFVFLSILSHSSA